MATMKTLRVCHSRDLPNLRDRSSDYLYLAYDKLDLYAGKNIINENYVITSALPEEPVPGMIYILNTDGSVYRYLDYSNQKIATIEDISQIEYLEKAGTLLQVNSNKRYLDPQTRTLTLPFNNGKYELNVSVRNDQIFNNDTVLKYSEEKERFEIYGPTHAEDITEEFVDYSGNFRGGNTSTVRVKVDGPRITADVQVSKLLSNVLKKASDGLYIKDTDIVTRGEFERWSRDVNDLRGKADDIINSINTDIEYMQNLISEENINTIIYNTLNERFDSIQVAIDNYDEIAARLDEVTNQVINYAHTKTEENRLELMDIITTNSTWDDLDAGAGSYTPEVDYTGKDDEYNYPGFTEEEANVVAALAIAQYMLLEEPGNELSGEENLEMRTFEIGMNGKLFTVTVREITGEPGTTVTPEPVEPDAGGTTEVTNPDETGTEVTNPDETGTGGESTGEGGTSTTEPEVTGDEPVGEEPTRDSVSEPVEAEVVEEVTTEDNGVVEEAVIVEDNTTDVTSNIDNNTVVDEQPLADTSEEVVSETVVEETIVTPENETM